MDLEAILDALAANPELISGVLPTVVDSQVGKDLIANKATALYNTKIDNEVKAIHTKYDDDIFGILGVRPGQNQDGTKQKTYDFLKTLLTELKDLRGQKDSLNKEAKVAELLQQIETLKNEGGGKFIQETFDKAKSEWETERQGYLDKIKAGEQSVTDFQKQTAISSGLGKIKFNPDVSESIRQMVIKSAEEQLKANSKIENGQIVFVDDKGELILDKTTYKPIDAFGALSQMDAIKDISLSDDGSKKGGGGADTKIVGSIETTKVEGKDKKSLKLDPNSFKSKSQFIKVAEKALVDGGISTRDPEWDQLKNAAYAEYEVAKLPATVEN